MDKKMVPEVRFKGFSDDWEQHEMKEVLNKQYNGQTPSRSKSSFWNGTIDWLTSGELNRSIVTRTNEKITSNGQKDANLKIIPKGTFVIAITGLEAVGTRGNCALLGIDTTLNQSCMALFTDEKKLSPKFLFQWYRKYGNEYGIRYTQGTKQQSYNAEIINKLPINLPALKEQKVINFLLSKVDIAITLQQEKINLYIKLKKGLLQKQFASDQEKVPKIRFFNFHENWEQRKLEKMIDLFSGLTYSPNDIKSSGTFVLRSSNIKSGNIVNADNVYVDNKVVNSSNVIRGDIIVVVRNGSRALIGKHALVQKSMPETVIGAFMTGIRSATPSFTNSLLDTQKFKKEINRNLGSTINQITNGSLKKMSFNVPNSLEEKSKIGTSFEIINKIIVMEQERLNELTSIKKYLLQKLFI